MAALGPLPDIHGHEKHVSVEEMKESADILNEALFQEDLGAQRDRARKTFDLADTDGSGYLTVDELPSVVRSLGLKLTDEETLRLAKKLFKEIDSDHSGRMDFNEFFHFYQSVLDNEKARRKLAKKLQKRALSQREKDEAAQVFGLYDKDNSGSISTSELEACVAQLLPIDLDPASLRTLVEDIVKRGDADHDGTIGLKEFQNFYSKCLSSAEAKSHYVEKLEKRYGRAMGLTDDELFG